VLGGLAAPPAPASAAIVRSHTAPSWQTNGRVRAIAVVGTVVYLGGKFTTVRPAGSPAGTGEIQRNHAAAVNLKTGKLLGWNPNVNGTVQSIAVDGTRVFLGGSFSQVGGAHRARLAAVNASTGALSTAWKPSANAAVLTLSVSGGAVYAGGRFTKIAGTAHPYLAALDRTSGAAHSSFTPNPDGAVAGSTVVGTGRLVVGGSFTHLHGSSQHHIAAVDPHSGATLQWAAHTPYALIDIASNGQGVYAAEAGPGGNFAAFNPATGAMKWQGGTDGNVQAITALDGYVYVGGHYENYCGPQAGQHTCATPTRRLKMLAVDEHTGHLQSWAPSVNSVLGVHALERTGDRLVMGGDFTKVAGSPQQGLAVFDETSADSTPPSIRRAPDARVTAGARLGRVAVPMTVAWAASDAASGVCRYRLQRSINGGPFNTVRLRSRTAHSAPVTATPNGGPTVFRVDAADCAGNRSGYTRGPTVRLAAVQDSSQAIAYHGRWTRKRPRRAYGRTVRQTGRRGAKAALTFTGRQIAWVATKGPTRGKASVYIDSKLVARVHLHALTTRRRSVVFRHAWRSNATHRITIEVAGMSGHPVVGIDALLILR
jgi:outer membrane protein assembly factor BamB